MSEDERKQSMEKIPLDRAAEPDEIAEAILFLASDAASFVNVSGLTVDGGIAAGRYLIQTDSSE